MKLNKNQAIDFILSSSEEVWAAYKTIYNLPSLPSILIGSEAKGTAGRAYKRGYKVWFNVAYCMTEGDAFIRTIRHELAHIIQLLLFPHARQAHGPEFRSILQNVGWDSSTYHTYNVVEAKQVAKKHKVFLIDSISSEEM
jgi:hypothetical protein